MNDKTPPPVVIAAGGHGSRIGGGKPLRLLSGRPLVDRAIDWAKTQSEQLAIAVRESDQILADQIPQLLDKQGDIGPISALDSAFAFATRHGQRHVLLIACDMPFLPTDLLFRLTQEIAQNGCAMPVSAGKDHPMAALWRVNQSALNNYIGGGGRSLWAFAKAAGVLRVHWPRNPDYDPDHDPFTNINDKAALARAEQWLKKQAR